MPGPLHGVQSCGSRESAVISTPAKRIKEGNRSRISHQDLEDRVFIPSGDFSAIIPDPTIGAGLFGCDEYFSTESYHDFPTTS